MSKIYGIVFNDNKKKQFIASNSEYNVDDLVVVLTERGENIAKIASVIEKAENLEDFNIVRKATKKDYDNYLTNLKDARKAYQKCCELVKNLNLDMGVLNAQFNLDRSQLLFNFTADSRIDFRDLAKKLAGFYHTRI